MISHLIDEVVQTGLEPRRGDASGGSPARGSFSIVVLSRDERDRLVAAKSATPIVIGLGDGENFVASDIPAILEHTRDVLFLEDGEMAEVTARRGHAVTTFDGDRVERAPRRVTWDAVTAQKGGYKHFLLKEIHEQPQAHHRHDARAHPAGSGRRAARRARADRGAAASASSASTLVACGTAWHACLVGKFLLERARAASRARSTTAASSATATRSSGRVTLLIVVSQSGETADTLGARRRRPRARRRVLAICNVVDSSIARRADAVLYTHAGPGDQRREHEGVHHAAHGALPARPPPRAPPRRARPERGPRAGARPA